MNIISGTEVGRAESTDSYAKGAMNVAYFLHLRGAKSLHLRVPPVQLRYHFIDCVLFAISVGALLDRLYKGTCNVLTLNNVNFIWIDATGTDGNGISSY